MDPQNLSPTTLIILLSILLLLKLLKQSTRGRKKLPPGPWKLPIIGNLHQLGSMPHRSLHHLALKHGPLMSLNLGSVPTLVISSSDVARQVFKSHDIAFSGRPALYAVKMLSYGFLDMAFAPYGEYWRQLRKVSMLELLSLKRVQSFCPVREAEVGLLIASIKKRSADVVNLSEMTLVLSNNVMCRVMFGDTYGGGGYDQGTTRFNEVLRETQELLGGFCLADFFPRLAWIHGLTGMKRRLAKNFEELDGFYNQVIEEHLNKKQEENDEDLVDVLLRLRKDPSYGSIFSSVNHIKGLIMV